jgi:predicted DNA binding CopG/RHH family protein
MQKTRVCTRLTDADIEKLRERAEARGLTLSEYIRFVLESGLDS